MSSIVNKKEEVFKKCCVINEIDDLVVDGFYGIVKDVSILKMKNIDIFNRYLKYRWDNNFIFHFYRADKMEKDIIIGVDRFDNCSIVEMNKEKLIIKIKLNISSAVHYNNSELKMLRKDRIGGILTSDK